MLFGLYAAQYFPMVNSLNAFGNFAATIIASLSFKDCSAQLFTVSPNIVAMIIIVGICFSNHCAGGARSMSLVPWQVVFMHLAG